MSPHCSSVRQVRPGLACVRRGGKVGEVRPPYGACLVFALLRLEPLQLERVDVVLGSHVLEHVLPLHVDPTVAVNPELIAQVVLDDDERHHDVPVVGSLVRFATGGHRPEKTEVERFFPLFTNAVEVDELWGNYRLTRILTIVLNHAGFVAPPKDLIDHVDRLRRQRLGDGAP